MLRSSEHRSSPRRKDLRLLLRDPRSAVILLLMPLVLILVLGLSLGEAFGQKPDDRIRISVVIEDAGLPPDAGPFPAEAVVGGASSTT